MVDLAVKVLGLVKNFLLLMKTQVFFMISFPFFISLLTTCNKAIYILLLFAWIGTIKEASCKNIHNSTNEIYQNWDF